MTTALAVLRSGWVIVSSLPTMDGTSVTGQAGCLIVLDNTGKPVETFFGSLINGPWDMAAFDGADQEWLFVTNVLNGTVVQNAPAGALGAVGVLGLMSIALGVAGGNYRQSARCNPVAGNAELGL